MTLCLMTLDMLLTDEYTQIHGIQVLLDFTDFRMAHAWAVDKAHVEKSSKCLQVLENVSSAGDISDRAMSLQVLGAGAI